MAVFYNSSAQIQSANVTNLSAASLVTGTIQSAQSAAINVSAVTGANTTGGLMSNLVFSNVGGQGITFGLATAAGAGTLTASAAGAGGVTMSHYDNMPLIDNLATTTLSSNATLLYLQPFQLPQAISIGWVRLLATFLNPGSTTLPVQTNTAILTYSAVTSWWINIYSLSAGASSESLFSYATTSGAHSYFVRASAAATNIAVHQATWNYYSRTQATQISWSGISTQTSFNFSQNATAFTNLTGLRFLDIPFATSLPAGNYWIGINNSVSTGTNNASMSGFSFSHSLLGVPQVSSQFREMGNTTQKGIVQGLGTVTLGAIGANISIDNISANASQPKIPFQLLRQV